MSDGLRQPVPVGCLPLELAAAKARASDESPKTAQTLATFELAQRLEAMAVERVIKPW